MILRLVEAVRRWDSHTLICGLCWAYDYDLDKDSAPCDAGLELIHSLLSALRDEGCALVRN